jgi:protein O-mannosyl-transferase
MRSDAARRSQKAGLRNDPKRAPVKRKASGASEKVPLSRNSLFFGKSKKSILVFSALAVLLSYSRTFSVPFYLDDSAIVTEGMLLKDFSLKTLSRIFFDSVTRNRPLANLTLAANYTLAGDPSRVWSFHAVNMAVHLGCFLFVFLFLQELLSLPAVPDRYRKRAFPIAWVASLVWALHPIQIQAVTYIIQRMTSLATLFFLMSLYFYLKARRGARRYFIGSGIAFLLGLGSKEIVAALPLVILALEAFVLRTRPRKLLGIALLVLVLSLPIAYLFLSNQWATLVREFKTNRFPNRDYTLTERVMTQPRVVLRYISLTLFPFYPRFILDNDVSPSRTLLSPPLTAVGVIVIGATLLWGFGVRRKNAVAAFCVASFWLGHVIEGSVFNLEMAFEHRMYLPSVFLILLAVVLAQDGLDRVRAGRAVRTGFFAVLVAYLSVNTFLRNEVWRDPIAFYRHNIEKTPGFFRPYHNLGTAYFFRGDFENAARAYRQAIDRNDNNGLSYFGAAQSYYALHDYAQAVPYFEKAVALRTWNNVLSVEFIESFIKLGRFEDGLRIASWSLQKFPDEPRISLMAGVACFYTVQREGDRGRRWLEAYGFSESSALACLEKAYDLGNRDILLYQNLPVARLKIAETERRPERKSELIEKAFNLAREGIAAFPEAIDLKVRLAKIVMVLDDASGGRATALMTKADLAGLALGLMNAGRFQEALEILTLSQIRLGADPFGEYQQAVCLYSLGREEDAVRIFRKIREGGSDPALRSRLDSYIQAWENKSRRK